MRKDAELEIIVGQQIFYTDGSWLVATDNSKAKVAWSKRFTQGKIAQLLLGNSRECLYVRYDYYEFVHGTLLSNLLKIDFNGDVLWVAELPEPDDTFVEIRYSEEDLVGFTWNCWRVILEEANGKILNSTFTK